MLKCWKYTDYFNVLSHCFINQDLVVERAAIAGKAPKA